MRFTERASWVCLSHGGRGLRLALTSPRVITTVNMSPCSAMKARDIAGAWTKMDRRSRGLAPDLAADQCVSKSQKEVTVSLTVALNKNYGSTNTSGVLMNWFVCVSIRYRPQYWAAARRTPATARCGRPDPRNTPAVCPERQDRARSSGGLRHEKERCQARPPPARKFIFKRGVIS